MTQTSCFQRLSQQKLYLNCRCKISIKPIYEYKLQVTRMKVTTISKIVNTSQMLIIPSISMYYIPPYLKYDVSSHHPYSCLNRHINKNLNNLNTQQTAKFSVTQYISLQSHQNNSVSTTSLTMQRSKLTINKQHFPINIFHPKQMFQSVHIKKSSLDFTTLFVKRLFYNLTLTVSVPQIF